MSTATRTWLVGFPNGISVEVRVHLVRHELGALILTDETGQPMGAIAAGEWSTVELVTEPRLIPEAETPERVVVDHQVGDPACFRFDTAASRFGQVCHPCRGAQGLT